MRVFILFALLAASLIAQNRGGGMPAPVGRAHSAAPIASHPPSSAPAPAHPVYPHPINSRPVTPYLYRPRTVVVPYPVFIGGGYSSNYADPGYSNPAPAAVVNQDFRADGGTPSMVDYSAVPLPEAANVDENGLRDDQPTIFLIALTDHSVLAAIAYWVDGDTLNWISRDASQNRLSLSLIDRDFSKQLNDERHIEFKLPALP